MIAIPSTSLKGLSAAEQSRRFAGWLRYQADNDFRRLQGRAAGGRDLDEQQIALELPESRSLHLNQDASGGILAPDNVLDRLVERLDNSGQSPIRRVAQVERVDKFPVTIPKADDAGAVGGIYTTDGTDWSGVAESPGLEAVTASRRKFFAAAKLSAEMIEDITPLALRRLGEIIGRRLARVANAKYSTGSTPEEPGGIDKQATLGETAATTSAVTCDELLALAFSVDSAYAQAEGAGFMCHTSIFEAIRKLKDDNGRYLFSAAGLDKYRWTLNDDLASSFAASAKVVFFGDWQQLLIVDRRDVTIRRLEQVLAATDEIIIVADLVSDSLLLEPTSIKYLQMAAS